MKRVICLMTFLALSVPVNQVHAQEIGDTQNGLAWAQQVYSSKRCRHNTNGEVAQLLGFPGRFQVGVISRVSH
jgi:hypothetical protein